MGARPAGRRRDEGLLVLVSFDVVFVVVRSGGRHLAAAAAAAAAGGADFVVACTYVSCLFSPSVVAIISERER